MSALWALALIHAATSIGFNLWPSRLCARTPRSLVCCPLLTCMHGSAQSDMQVLCRSSSSSHGRRECYWRSARFLTPVRASSLGQLLFGGAWVGEPDKFFASYTGVDRQRRFWCELVCPVCRHTLHSNSVRLTPFLPLTLGTQTIAVLVRPRVPCMQAHVMKRHPEARRQRQAPRVCGLH